MGEEVENYQKKSYKKYSFFSRQPCHAPPTHLPHHGLGPHPESMHSSRTVTPTGQEASGCVGDVFSSLSKVV